MVREQIALEEQKANEIVNSFEEKIEQCKRESQETKEGFAEKIQKTCEMQDQICHEK